MNKFKGLIPYKKSILCIVIMAVLLLMNGYGHDKAHHNLKVSSVNHSGQQTYTPHFSYPKGEYRLSVNGSGTFYIYTADGNVLYQGTPDGIITLTLEKDESEIIFCSGETGTLSSFTIEKKGGLFLDDIVLTLSIVGMLSFVLYCTNKKGTITDDHITQILLLGIAVVATFPAFTETIIFGHDLNFHLYRIEGIKDGLLAGQFPVRIHPTHNNGYGYITPSVYPELFLYIPALLRILGVSAVSAYHIFLFCINIATAVIMYISAKGITNSAFSGKIAAVIYTFSTWRVINLYYRAALGEALAMIFFPLVFYGMYLILKGNHKKWWVLTLACTGVFMSHIISTVMVALIIITFVIIFWKDFISKERFCGI